MSYSELPPIIKSVSTHHGITVAGMKEVKGCCLNQLSIIRPNTIGTRMVCNKCDNMLTCTESTVQLFKHRQSPLEPLQFEKGIAIHLVQFAKPFWTMYTVDEYLRKAKINKSYVKEDGQNITVVQCAAEWFEKGSVQITTPGNGICQLVGKVKAGFEKKVAAVEKSGQGPGNPIEVY